jgi:pimeloyl-ACP methyl ester carboxylesterase
MFDLPDWLRSDGYDVYVAQYQNDSYDTPSIEELAEWLSTQVESLATLSPTGTVILIAHSLGGLVVRACIDSARYQKLATHLGRSPIEKAFLVGTPHQGTGFRKLLRLAMDFPNSPNQVACRQMSDQTYMRRFNQRYTHYDSPVPYFVIGGQRVKTPLGHLFSAYLWLTQKDISDGIFTVRNTTTLPGKYVFAVVSACHEPPLGDQYFEKQADGAASETYLRCIRPVLQEENDAAFTNRRPERNPQSVLYLLCAPFFFSGLFVLLFIRLLSYRLVQLTRKNQGKTHVLSL